jgi:hypothetical protein
VQRAQLRVRQAARAHVVLGVHLDEAGRSCVAEQVVEVLRLKPMPACSGRPAGGRKAATPERRRAGSRLRLRRRRNSALLLHRRFGELASWP